MKRIILGLVTIVGAGAVIASGFTGAFFSDTETSTGNTFAAGAIDLLVDNESYYNGNKCTFFPATSTPEFWAWTGNAIYPVSGSPCTTSWDLSNLDEGRLFFNFLDLKPDDDGEDTISLHVQNDAWACMDLTLTSNSENGVNEPEITAGDDPNANGEWDGELAQNIQMIWWADDGDNVLEDGELILSSGVKTLFDLASTSGPFSVALADSQNNVWGFPVGTPLPADKTVYIAKAWCFGTLTLNPVSQGSGDPVTNPGWSCNGTAIPNVNRTQTDGATLDVQFRAVQARHNGNFLCRGNCEINTQVTLIPDSGFETPVVNTAQQWDIFDSPAGAWSVAWRDDIPATYNGQTRPDIAHLEIHKGVLGASFEGDQYAELDSDWGGPADSRNGEPASVMIYQDISTVPGRAYQIRFAFAARPNTPASDNRLEVKWGGVAVHDTGFVGDPNAGIEWNEIIVDVVATTATTRLAFTDLGTANSQGTFLDDIRLYSEVCE